MTHAQIASTDGSADSKSRLTCCNTEAIAPVFTSLLYSASESTCNVRSETRLVSCPETAACLRGGGTVVLEG
eukprot:352652-Chlamydomonas_euryale.AAC.7